MMIKWRGANHHRTRDEVSPAAIKTLQVARFPAGHSAVCNCAASGGKMKPKDCDGLTVYNGDNAEVARFTGKQFRAQQSDDGGIIVFSMPGSGMRTGDVLTSTEMMLRIAAINKANAKFWRLNDEEEK
jgi:hypothetical protein